MSKLVKQFIIGDITYFVGDEFVPLSIKIDESYLSGYCVKVHLLKTHIITEIDLQFVTNLGDTLEEKVSYVKALIEENKPLF